MPIITKKETPDSIPFMRYGVLQKIMKGQFPRISEATVQYIHSLLHFENWKGNPRGVYEDIGDALLNSLAPIDDLSIDTETRKKTEDDIKEFCDFIFNKLITAPQFETKRAYVLKKIDKRWREAELDAEQHELENSQKSPMQQTTKEEGSDKMEEM